MSETQKNGGESVIRYKKIVQVGVNTIVNDEPQSVIVTKVLCTKTLLVDINKCARCKFNSGIYQYLVHCKNDNSEPLPEELAKDIDYPEVKNDGKK